MRRGTKILMIALSLLATVVLSASVYAADEESPYPLGDPMAPYFLLPSSLPVDLLPPERAPVEISDAERAVDPGGLPLALLELDQPVRIRENNMLLKFRAPGDGQSLATFEVVF